MKKLLVLMLVLGITSVTNAAIMLSINGDTSIDTIELCEGGTVIIDLFSDADNTAYGAYVGIIGGEDGGDWTGNYTVYPIAGGTAVTDFGITYPGWWYAEANTNDPDNKPISAGRHFDYEFQCLLAGVDVTIELEDAAGTPVDWVYIHQVPEPASMLLLGLGGLLLRRRK